MYEPKNAREVRMGLEPGLVTEAVVVQVEKGKVSDFVKNFDKWKGDVSQTAINVWFNASVEGKVITHKRMFTYNVGSDGVTEYNVNSNLARYKKKYGKLPDMGDKVYLQANSDGFLELVY